jgi:hypothetical protein
VDERVPRPAVEARGADVLQAEAQAFAVEDPVLIRVTPARLSAAASAGSPFTSSAKVAESARAPFGRPAAPHPSFFAVMSSASRFRSSADIRAISAPRGSTDSKPCLAAMALSSAWVLTPPRPIIPGIRFSVNLRAGTGPAAGAADPAGAGWAWAAAADAVRASGTEAASRVVRTRTSRRVGRDMPGSLP